MALIRPGPEHEGRIWADPQSDKYLSRFIRNIFLSSNAFLCFFFFLFYFFSNTSYEFILQQFSIHHRARKTRQSYCLSNSEPIKKYLTQKHEAINPGALFVLTIHVRALRVEMVKRDFKCPIGFKRKKGEKRKSFWPRLTPGIKQAESGPGAPSIPGPRTASLPPGAGTKRAKFSATQSNSGSRRTEIRVRKQILIRTIRRKTKKKGCKTAASTRDLYNKRRQTGSEEARL